MSVDKNAAGNMIIVSMTKKLNDKPHQTLQKGPYVLYSEADIQKLLYLKSSSASHSAISLDSCLRVYQGQTVFSIFYNDKHVLEMMKKRLLE